MKASTLKNLCSIAKKNDSPKLASVRIESDENGSTWSVFNFDALITIQDKSIGEVKGSLNAGLLFDRLKAIKPGSTLAIHHENGNIYFENGITLSMPVFTDEFPSLTPKGYAGNMEMTTSSLLDTFSRLEPLAAKDDYRPALNGIFVDGERKKFVATNSHIMGAEHNNSIPNVNPIILRPIVVYLKKFHKVVGEICNLHFYEEYTAFSFSDGSCIISRNIDGQFPAYEKVIPDYKNKLDFLVTTTITLERDTIDAIAKIAGNKGPCGSNKRLDITCKGETAIFSTNLDNAIAFSATNYYHGPDCTLGSNALYMKRLMAFIGEDTIPLTVQVEDDGSVTYVMTAEKGGRLALLMPIRVQNNN